MDCSLLQIEKLHIDASKLDNNSVNTAADATSLLSGFHERLMATKSSFGATKTQPFDPWTIKLRSVRSHSRCLQKGNLDESIRNFMSEVPQ
jgi:hypothetical protein